MSHSKTPPRRGSLPRARLPALLLLVFAARSLAAGPGPADQPAVVVGHLVPDCDSIGGAIGAALLLDAVAVRQGPINAETRFVLEEFGAAAPPLLEDFAGRKVYLIDHNQTTQGSGSLGAAEIQGLIDHHALGDSAYVTSRPVLVDIRPWGSTCSIIADRLLAAGREIPRPVAGVLLGGILSDTLGLTGPTTTLEDRALAKKLATMAKVDDMDALAKKMMEVKSDVGKLSDRELVLADIKEFEFGATRLGFAVAESVAPDPILARRAGLQAELSRVKAELKLDYLFLAVVDIAAKRSWLVFEGESERRLAEQSYQGRMDGPVMVLPGLVSRKLQLIPPLQKTLGAAR